MSSAATKRARPQRVKTRVLPGAAVHVSVHPLAELFPAIEGAGFAEMVADIRASGLREKIVLTRGRAILDGRNRFAAAIEAGLLANPVPLADLARFFRLKRPSEGTDLAFVLSANLHRRHLSESQRALVAARLANMGHGGARRGGRNCGVQGPNPDVETGAGAAAVPAGSMAVPALSMADAGQMLHVARSSVAVARGVLASGAPGLVDAVARGEVSLNVAGAVAALPAGEQAEIVARGRGEIMAAARRYRAEEQAGKAARRAAREQALAASIAGGNAALVAAGAAGSRYGVILADPEWRFAPWGEAGGMDRAADNHYPTSPLEVIVARPVAEIAADDAVLFLWATVPMLPQALEVMAAWGFAYKSHFIWDKGRSGTGYWNRNRHELLLIGTRGAVPAPAMGTQWPSLFAEPAGEHSAKPACAYELIENYFPTLPKIELNARGARAGWDTWGAEAPETEQS